MVYSPPVHQTWFLKEERIDYSADENEASSSISRRILTPETIELAEQQIRFLRIEQAHCYRNGIPLFSKEGDARKIAFNAEELGELRGAVVIHNHPNGQNFSRADFRFALDADLAEIRVITATKRYSIERPATGWAVDSFEVYERNFRTCYFRHRKDFDRGGFPRLF
ncbi:MAG: hypothetical protein OHK0029_27480 [Armatimonadaceae bacterium]